MTARSIKLGDIRPLFINNFIIILLFVCAFMLLLGGIKFYLSGVPADVDNTEKSEALKQEIATLTAKSKTLKDEIIQVQNNLENLQKRADTFQVEKSERAFLMVDSEKVPVYELNFVVSSTSENIPIETIRTEYLNLARRDKLYAHVAGVLGNSVNRYQLVELINVAKIGKNSEMRVRVIHNNADTALKIAWATYEYLKDEVNKVIPEADAKDISDVSKLDAINSIRTIQINHQSDIDATNEAITEAGASLDEKQAEYDDIANELKKLQETENSLADNTVVVISIADRLKTTVIFAVLGMFVGIVAGYATVMILFICDRRILTVSDIEQRYNIGVFGVATNAWYKVLGRKPIPRNSTLPDQMIDLITANINLAVDPAHPSATFLLTGTSALPEAQAVADKLTSRFKGFDDPEISIAGNPLDTADAVVSLSKAAHVVLIEKLGTAQRDDVDRLIVKLDKANKEISGIILV